jgi:hypothetical protein
MAGTSNKILVFVLILTFLAGIYFIFTQSSSEGFYNELRYEKYDVSEYDKTLQYLNDEDVEFVDENGNVVDENGNLMDENGNVDDQTDAITYVDTEYTDFINNEQGVISPDPMEPNFAATGLPNMSDQGAGFEKGSYDYIQKSKQEDCPDLLIKRGQELLLYNTRKPEEDGVNPIRFGSLDDYIYYIKVQRTRYGSHCPILYLQEETNAQGQDVYRMRPGPFDMQSGTPVSQTSPDNVQSIGQFFNGALGNFQPDLPRVPTAVPFNSVETQTQIQNIIKNVMQNVNQGSQNAPNNQNSMAPIMIPINIVPPLGQDGSPSDGSTVVVREPPLPIMNTQALNSQFENNDTQEVQEVQTDTQHGSQGSTIPYVNADVEHKPYNQNMYNAFDPQGLYVGQYTTLDQIHDSTINANGEGEYSDNAMDPNWGGVRYTSKMVQSGKYDDNIVTRPLLSAAPNTVYIPQLQPELKPISTFTLKSAPSNA